jgi:hypothetical protein
MGRTCPDGLLAVLSTSSKRAKRLSHYEIFFWKGGPTTTFSNPLLPSPRVFFFFREKWETIEIFILTKWQSDERKKRERTKEERERWKDTELERRENAV